MASSDDELAAALKDARTRAIGKRPCSLCDVMKSASPRRRKLIQEGLDSPIGIIRLTNILQANGVLVGRPTVDAHRKERHTA